MKYHLVTLGCQMNISDGERVRQVIDGMGYEYTENDDEANLLGIIACSVRQKPIDKVYNKIAVWNRRKNKTHLITFISGCILPKDKEQFLKSFDIIFSMSELTKLPEMIKSYGITSHVSLDENLSGFPKNSLIKDFWNIRPHYNSSFEAYVPIQNGCDKFCTYCAVPYTRGREVSRLSTEIVGEIIQLVEKGYKSITLLGQNVNSYGLDKNGDEISFAALLQKIGEYGNSTDKEFLIYFTSPHPKDMTNEVIDVISNYKCLANQIHLPLQSGDDNILMKMNRKHSVEKYGQIINYIRQKLPDATIFTDIIVGFTGETDEEFENTRKAFDAFKFNMAYIAKYSPRPGAASYKWQDDVDSEVKKQRYHTLTTDLAKHTAPFNQSLHNKTLRVLVTGKEKRSEYLSGYTEGRIPVRIFSDDKSRIGQFIDVKVTAVSDFSIAGEMVLELNEQIAG